MRKILPLRLEISSEPMPPTAQQISSFGLCEYGKLPAPTEPSWRSTCPLGGANMCAQSWFNANLVRLQKAVLCANCDVISEGLNGHCAACGSEALLALSQLLGGTIEAGFPLTIPASTQTANTPAPSGYFSAAA
jgi:hypothetical protein